ncbi:Ribosome biogenesis protein RPF1, contains IMP4 domain [Phaffia rhodozyma]|uniref:Ribosome biogenesis protein RPF1, contains IMP4 domain n=1 Tax=Phaffia rhodozyma TaxID=264483 RepID=A0A0F7SN49_PHARH|nr:Ribosome biogenesis protein RPF1, contains IMP4 domain [Phaffia rhodozyma]
MPVAPSSIKNAYKRSDVYRKQKREKSQDKLRRRLETKKDEASADGGEARKKKRVSTNIPRTIDNTREFGHSYLTSDPTASTSTSALNIDDNNSNEDEDGKDDNEAGPSASSFPPEEDLEGGIGAIPSSRGPGRDPRVLLTTSPKATRETYTFAEELRGIFPGGEFFKRPVGKGFELGRISRWASQRDYDAVIVINEDRKKLNAITIINLPNGPTAYFKLTSVELSKQISGHARPTPHSPELILNNFSTRLGLSIGKLFGSLFPPLPQFEGRQVVTLHNQRDFLFFRRHRYMFKSLEKTALQEIGPRFTLKLRWLRKGLPAVTAGGSMAVDVAPGADEDEEDEDEAVNVEDGEDKINDENEAEAEDNEKERGSDEDEEDDDDEDEEDEEKKTTKKSKRAVPPLNAQGEFEWKWKPKMEVSRKMFFL